MKYIILIIIILLFLLVLSNYEIVENFQNDDYIVTELDTKARENANCNPIKKEWVDSFWIWTVPDSCEQGLPHTRDKDIIAMPESYSGNYDKTIIHEKVHLNQRRNPEEWINFYKSYWDYEIFSKPPNFIPKELVEKRRANPDISIQPWCCWRKRWWSVPIYKDNLRLSSTPIMWYDQKEDKILDKPPKEWIDFFGNDIAQIEHPHEISAVILSEKSFRKNKTSAIDILINKFNLI